MSNEVYRPEDYGKKEEEMMVKYHLQKQDARDYFLSCIKPRLDRSYKLYIAYNGDRAAQIKEWQANIFVPYIHAVVETLKPRILDARPEFTVQGRTELDQVKAPKLQQLMDFAWEKSRMDKTSEAITHASMVYGTAYLQVSWKKDVREHRFLSTQDILDKKLKWEKREEIFYDAPFAEHVDNYALMYDWHNVDREQKQYWFKRLVLTGASIKRKYPMADKKRLKLALDNPGGDLEDYGAIRNEVKTVHEGTYKGADVNQAVGSLGSERYTSQIDNDLNMYEVFEWWRPFDDEYAVMVNDIPILKGGSIPIPYDFKEAPFIAIPYLSMPGEFEGYGIPLILENPQVMLNMVKNQRLDAATLNIHKMWIVNPLANIDKRDLVTRPFGIIYSTDPNGVREVQFSDVKASAYKEEELLKSDMRYASGVDDFSMGVGGGAGSATEVRHLRESTLERVRLFVNHLGDAYADLMRYWICMHRQFFTEDMTIRIIGDDGRELFPIIEKDDLSGEFDYRASVLPSIAGQNDIKKKQDMDLFQLLITLPFVDPKKLTGKILHDWNWSLEAIAKGEGEEADQAAMMGEEGMPPGAEGQMPPGMEGMPPEMMQMMGGGEPGMAPGGAAGQMQGLPVRTKNISPQSVQNIMRMLGKKGSPGQAQGMSPFAEASSPINLLQAGGPPPTPKGVSAGGGGRGGGGMPTTNPRGFNRGGKVNTNIPLKSNSTPESTLMNRAFSLQSKKNK